MLATLNLLSPEKKSSLRAGYVLAFGQTLVLLVFTVSAFAFFTMLAVRMMLVATRDDLASRSAGAEAELGTVSIEARQINDYLGRIEGYQRRFTAPSILIRQIAALVPPGAVLTEIRIEDESVSVSGNADTREDVLTLQSALRSSGHFADVQSPLSNILQQRDVKFDFRMRLAAPAADAR